MYRYTRNQRGLATWAKWLIGILATFLVLGLATCGIACFVGFNFVKDATNPDKAKALAGTMVSISDPLPAPYEYKMSFDMMGVKFVTIMDSNTEYSYSFVKMPNTKQSDMSPEDMVESMAVQGVPSGGSGGTTKIDVKSKGKMTVGGTEMPYVIGDTTNKGQKVPSLMGVIKTGDGHLVMIIAMASPNSTDLDLNQVQKFFSMITAFK